MWNAHATEESIPDQYAFNQLIVKMLALALTASLHELIDYGPVGRDILHWHPLSVLDGVVLGTHVAVRPRSTERQARLRT